MLKLLQILLHKFTNEKVNMDALRALIYAIFLQMKTFYKEWKK